MSPLPRSFFARPHLLVARELLGCELVVGDCGGRVVETEGYAFQEDEACHVAVRPSARAFVAEHPPGTAYCYLNYGLHWLLNVLAGDGIVLLRGLEPRRGIELMQHRRGRQALEQLASGPGKLGQALALGAERHGQDFCAGQRDFAFYPAASAEPGEEVAEVAVGPRIGITKAVDLPWRF